MATAPSTAVAVPVGRRIHLPATFRALRHRNYRLWFFGQGISLIGTWMQTMAQQVLVYRLTDSATALGMVSFISLIPSCRWRCGRGRSPDRLPKRTILVITQTIMLIQALVLAVLTWTGAGQVWHVMVLAFVLGAANAVDMPVRQAFTVDMVEAKEDLTNAIALNSAIFNGARALGPALAGLAVAATGEGMAFFLNALELRRRHCRLADDAQRARPSERPSKGAGVGAHGRRRPLCASAAIILLLCSLIAVSAFLSMPYNTLMPVFADGILGPSAQPVVAFICGGAHPLLRCQAPEALPLGLLLTAVGIGAVIGALLVASLPNSSRRGPMLTIGNLGFPLVLADLCLIALVRAVATC